MHEIEVKILDIKPAEIIKTLKKAGAKKVFETQIKARLYDFPDRKIKKSGNLVRLRTIAGKTEITFKKKISKKKVKDCEETDVIVNNFNVADKFLKSLGLKDFKNYTKKRIRYKLGEYQYEIDKYPGIPHFVEVEVKSGNPKTALKKLEKAVKVLGYGMKDTKPWTGLDVHKYYKNKL